MYQLRSRIIGVLIGLIEICGLSHRLDGIRCLREANTKCRGGIAPPMSLNELLYVSDNVVVFQTYAFECDLFLKPPLQKLDRLYRTKLSFI